MADIVERMKWWAAKRRPPRSMPTLPADCAEAAEEIERLQTELEHFYALAVDDPGKNPPTFWKDRCANLEKALEAIVGETEVHTKLNQERLCCKFQHIARAALTEAKGGGADE